MGRFESDNLIPGVGKALAVAAAAALLVAAALSQSQPKEGKGDKTGGPLTTRLRLEVTGGEKDVPVGSASVYVRYEVERSMRRPKKFEMNLKTNQDGKTKVPEIPQGKVLIQVVAPGWKTFGQWYDVNKDEETIKIKLEKPPHWY